MHQNIRATSLSFVKKSRNQKSFWQAHYTKPKIFQNAVYVSFMKKDVFLCVFATCNYDFIQSLILRILSIILIRQWNIIFDTNSKISALFGIFDFNYFDYPDQLIRFLFYHTEAITCVSNFWNTLITSSFNG